MHLLRGYQHQQNSYADIGLFTFYREQAEREPEIIKHKNKQKGNSHHIKRKYANNTNQQHINRKKTKKKLSTLMNNADTIKQAESEELEQKKQTINSDVYRRIKIKSTEEEDENAITQKNKNKLEQSLQKNKIVREKGYYNSSAEQQIFTNRKNIILNKKLRKNQFYTPQGESKPKYHSPKSQLIQFLYNSNNYNNDKRHLKTNSSEEISKFGTISNKQDKQTLPMIKNKINLGLRHSSDNQEKVYRFIQQKDYQRSKQRQSIELTPKQSPKHTIAKNNKQLINYFNKIRKQRQKYANNLQNNSKTDQELYGGFVMVSSRQHKLLTQRKQAPLINALKQYSSYNF